MTIPNRLILRRMIPTCLLLAIMAEAERMLSNALGDHLIAVMLLLIALIVVLAAMAPVSGGRR